ncbi:MAG TPA: T9SS type A sorting domain-containing protein [Candidatus Kapabacteria bacterium]|nr:T9SS type A sorting domain-containing protein [Candidatus Kapabacteria bacterium]
MNRTLLCIAITLLSAATLCAQGKGERTPSNAERARPWLDPDLQEEYPEGLSEWEKYPYIQSSPTISTQFGLFNNRNMVVEAKQAAQNESSIAINPVRPNVLIASAVDSRGAWVYISTDGGRTWRDTSFVTLHPDWTIGNDPSCGFDFEGNGYVMYGGFSGTTSGSPNGVYISKTTDDGLTWKDYAVMDHTAKGTPDSSFEDKYYVEIDNSASSPRRGTMYTPWKRVIDRDSSTQIMVARSTDRGVTWAAPVAVSPRKHGSSLDTTFGQSFPLTACGPNGDLYVVWNDGPARSIGFAKSTDGGRTFSAPTFAVQGYATQGTAKKSGGSVYHVLKGTFRAETYPTMMADNSNSPRRGWLYLAWAAGTRPDVFFIRSTDGGGTWSLPKVIHSDTTGDQWWPWLSVDQTNGDIAVMYSDSRNDPENILVDTYISYSRDGGDTWVDRRATDYMSDFRKNPFGGIFAGDYSGNAFRGGMVYPSHLDTREDNDVFTAMVNVRAPYPVENLVARGRADNLQEVAISWTYPHTSESVFGYPITGYAFEVRRGQTVVARLPPATLSYTESGLTVDSTYLYTVRVVAGTDTSADRMVSYRPSDAALPARPAIVQANGYAPQIQLVTHIPATRADSSTPLGNLKGYRIYRDGVLLREENLAPGDTGRTIPINDTPAERGYYRYAVTIIDGSAPAKESASSDTVTLYAGDLSQYAETFDGTRPRFLYGGTWGLTDTIALSAPNSLTDSPGGDYLPRRASTTQIFPVAMPGPVVLKFAHIAIVDPGDSATVEASYDRGSTWNVLARYSFQSDPSWADKLANPGDWRQEILTLNHPAPGPDAIGIVRFRMASGAITQADGWYLDNIEFGGKAAVEVAAGGDAAGLADRVFPNPASTAAVIEYRLARASSVQLRVYDLVGRPVATLVDGVQEAGTHAATLDTGDLPEGTYFYRIQAGTASARGRVVVARVK